MASPPIHQMNSHARQVEMLRQARQSQLAAQVGASRDYERRSFLRRFWFSRQRTSDEVPEAAPALTPP